MCTILSFDKPLFRKFEDEIVAQIVQDGKHNSDGSSLILIGKTKDKVVHLRTMNVEFITQFLTDNDDWERAWVHNRMATTQFRGLVGAHGFHGRFKGDDWYLMHNGQFRHQDARDFRVDSEWMMAILEAYGPKSALQVIAENETYANLFLVCPTEGKWTMLRASGGSLYTDGNGNYSTSSIKDVIDKVVPINTSAEHKLDVGYKVYDYSHQGQGRNWHDRRSHGAGTKGDEGKKETGSAQSGPTTGPTTSTATTGEVTVTTKADKSGRNWRRSSASGLWFHVDGEVTSVRRTVS